MMHVWFIGFKGASRRNCTQKQGETSFSREQVFLFSRNSRVMVLGFDSLVFVDREGQNILGLALPVTLLLRSLMLGGWLTHGDLGFTCLVLISWRLR